MNLRKQQALQTYHHILSTAKELATDIPYENLSVEQICDCAGISKGGFYHHFSSKDELIAVLFGCELDNLLTKHLTQNSTQTTAFEQLKIYLDTIVEFLETNPKDTVIRCWLLLLKHPEIQDNEFLLESFQILYQIIEKGKQDGTIRSELDTDFCQAFLNGTLTGIILYASAFKDSQSLKNYTTDSLKLLLSKSPMNHCF